MNMILHGIEAPNIRHTNTLTENVMDIQERDRHDIVLANPPFGGGERKEVQQNFPIKHGRDRLPLPAALHPQAPGRRPRRGGHQEHLPQQHRQRLGGAAQGAAGKLQPAHVLDCPGGTFQGAGVKTVVLFFEKGAPTRKVWYYQLDPGRNLGKTNPLNDDDLAEFVALQRPERFAERRPEELERGCG
jgi:type I restriction enzyme M protein